MQMTEILRAHLNELGEAILDPIMLFSDLDEMPRRDTVELLRKCEWESPMHLGMRSYLYSFEWEEGGEAESWRAQAWIWKDRGKGYEEYYRYDTLAAWPTSRLRLKNPNPKKNKKQK